MFKFFMVAISMTLVTSFSQAEIIKTVDKKSMDTTIELLRALRNECSLNDMDCLYNNALEAYEAGDYQTANTILLMIIKK